MTTYYTLPNEVHDFVMDEVGAIEAKDDDPRTERFRFAQVLCSALEHFPQPCAVCGKQRESHLGPKAQCI